ncbi:hypothetical protein D3C78_1501670 [compost metagenome]
MPFYSILKLCRLHTRRANEYIDPFVFRETLPTFKHLVQIHIGHLNRLQATDAKWVAIPRLFIKKVIHLQHTPDATC